MIAAAAMIVLCIAPAARATPAQVRAYDLGVTTIASSPRPLPVRLWGAIGLPTTPGPHPLVVVAHGRHADNCPRRRGLMSWPCWKDERRSDLGLRHIVAALAENGIAAIAPDFNAAFTFFWPGTAGDSHEERWPLIAERTLAELNAAAQTGSSAFGMPLAGRVDFADPPAFLAHSLSGANAVRYAGTHQISALLLLAPVFDHEGPPDVPTAIVDSACDNDVPGQGHRYFTRAKLAPRSAPVFFVRLEGANHNYYNSTLSRGGRNDAQFLTRKGCRSGERISARRQQAWIDRFASSFFAAVLSGAPAPGWMQPGLPFPTRIDGLPVGYDRIVPGA